MTRLYMTHNGIRTVLAMRYEIAQAAGDPAWRDPEAHSDDSVLVKYDELGDDPGKNRYGFTEEIVLS